MSFVLPLNVVFEIALLSTQAVDHPYQNLSVKVRIDCPDGSHFEIPAFWAGENRWKFRVSAPKPGVYQYRTACSDPANAGLHDQTGQFTAVETESSNPLLAHGRLCVSPDKTYLMHEDGTPFLWVADTWWMGLTSRLDWPGGVRTLAADRAAKGFSVIQIVAGPLPDMDWGDPRGMNEAGLPLNEDFSEINPAWFDHADLKIAHLVESGLLPCIVGMWGYYLPRMGVEKAQRFWEYLVARYGAYPVVWCIAGEGTMPYYLSKSPQEDAALQKSGWSEVMLHVRRIDGYKNLITIHPTQFGRDMVDDPALMDFEMLQTGHGDIDSIPNVRESVARSVVREPVMPVINSEVNYEGIMGYCWQNIQRWCFYVTLLNGAAGHTYGANGIWQMSTPEKPYGPSPHGRSWGNTPWIEACQLPGSRQVGLGANLLRRYPWWRMKPHPEWIEPAHARDPWRFAGAGIPGELRVFYISHLWDPPLIKSIEKGVDYQAFYFDPTSGREFDAGLVAPDAEGNWRPALPPEVHDWVLVMEKKNG